MPRSGKLVVITGPSGVGKSTIVREVLRRVDAVYSVSVTTRPPRADEADGRDYRFVDRPAFRGMIADGSLLEWAEVFGEYYGTPARPVEEALAEGKNVLLDIDIQGGLQVHRKMPSAAFVLVLPPDYDELRRRLAGRGTEPDEVLERRLAQARREVAAARASGIYTHVVVNDDLAAAVEKVAEIITQEPTRK